MRLNIINQKVLVSQCNNKIFDITDFTSTYKKYFLELLQQLRFQDNYNYVFPSQSTLAYHKRQRSLIMQNLHN